MKTTEYRVERRIRKLGPLAGYWKPLSNHKTIGPARRKTNRLSAIGQRVRILKITTEELPR